MNIPVISEVLGVIGDTVGNVAGGAGGAVVGMLIASGVIAFMAGPAIKAVGKKIDELIDNYNEAAKAWRAKNENEWLSGLFDGFIRTADQVLKGKEGKEKAEWVIKKVQDIVPDNIANDKDLRLFLEGRYNVIKREISEHSGVVG